MLAGIVVLLKRAPDQSFNSQMQKKEVADPCAETCPKGALGGVLLNFFGPQGGGALGRGQNEYYRGFKQ